jgi:hypothetical protein
VSHKIVFCVSQKISGFPPLNLYGLVAVNNKKAELSIFSELANKSLSVYYSATTGNCSPEWVVFFSLLPVKPDEGKSSKRLTKIERQQISMPADLKQISGFPPLNLYGLVAVNNWAYAGRSVLRNKLGNARFIFGQGLVNQEYFFHVYDLFKSYCGTTGPYTSNNKPDKRTGKIYNMMSFKTFSLPCFSEFHDLFYPLGKK